MSIKVNNDTHKRYVIVLLGDNSGCSHVRHRFTHFYMSAHDHFGFVPIMTPIPIFDVNILMQTKAIIIQRPVSRYMLDIVKNYKSLQSKYKYKLISEFDDQLWTIEGQGIPEYNSSSMRFNIKETDEVCKESLPLFDLCVVSTDYLKMKLVEHFNLKNIEVLHNRIPRYLWNKSRKEKKEIDLIKPKVLYSGSPLHYRNPVPPRKPTPENPSGFSGITELKGDFKYGWIEWLIKNIKEEKIDFVVMGVVPWFLEEVKDMIELVGWVDTVSYARTILNINADFQIAPLVNNPFNKCKSNLRYLESCASGSVLLANVFDDNKHSPFEDIPEECKISEFATASEIDEKFWKLCDKDLYNNILNKNYNYLNDNGCWTESDTHLNKMICMVEPEENNLI